MKKAYKDYFREILRKYRQQKAGWEETKFLETYYDMFDVKEDLINDENEPSFYQLKDEMKAKIDQTISGPKIKKLNYGWIKYGAAAAALLLVSVSIYWFTYQQKTDPIAQMDHAISPGGNNAILTLANGQKIVLNDVAKGEISKESGISVSKSKDGELIYTVIDANEKPTENTLNTISTPKGGQYTIMLSDGTKVMLNSASSLTFPTALDGQDRLVELNGEAYFEVAKRKNSRFRVISGVQTVEVLGTHFNVNAYADEQAIKTTLLEGAVKVSTPKASALIEPGEQAVLDRVYGNSIAKHRVNINKETAWINGIFSFEGDDLKSVMRQVARWYDVNVIYVGPISEEKYYGEISRSSKLSEVIKILELNNVNFEVVGKTVKVSYNQRPSL